MGSGLEGLNGCSFRTERRAMIPKVWQSMQRRGFGFLKAPPFSGKTSFIQQLLNFAEGRGWRAFYFNCGTLKDGWKLDAVLRHACGGTLAELMEKGEVTNAGKRRGHPLWPGNAGWRWGMYMGCVRVGRGGMWRCDEGVGKLTCSTGRGAGERVIPTRGDLGGWNRALCCGVWWGWGEV